MVVIPQLAPDGTGVPVSVPSPSHFRPLRGIPRLANWSPQAGWAPKGLTAAQKAGLHYEQKAQLFLEARLGPKFQQQPLLRFEDDAGPRALVPDGLYFEADGTAYVFEIKSQHMPEAWWQLRRLYEPVLRALPAVQRVSCVEVVRSFDPSMGFPEEPFVIRDDIYAVLSSPVAPLKVFVWKPH